MVALYQASLSFIWSATRVKYLHQSQAYMTRIISRMHVLQREGCMVFQIRIPTLWIPEPVYYPCRNDGVFHSLINFGFYILCKMQIITDNGRSIYEVLYTIYSIELANSRKSMTYFMKRTDRLMSFCCFVSQFPLLEIFRNLYAALDI